MGFEIGIQKEEMEKFFYPYFLLVSLFLFPYCYLSLGIALVECEQVTRLYLGRRRIFCFKAKVTWILYWHCVFQVCYSKFHGVILRWCSFRQQLSKYLIDNLHKSRPRILPNLIVIWRLEKSPELESSASDTRLCLKLLNYL